MRWQRARWRIRDRRQKVQARYHGEKGGGRDEKGGRKTDYAGTAGTVCEMTAEIPGTMPEETVPEETAAPEGKSGERKIMTAMSGGVDSSAAVFLLLEQGFDVGGMTMRLLEGNLSDRDVKDAEEAAKTAGIPFYVADLRERFRREVIGDFIDSYLSGNTPNPCVLCNRRIKFSAFAEHAQRYGYEKIATGHYAVSGYDGGSGRWLLKRSKDRKKDQSYMLYGLSQDQLAKSVFPLGEMTKEEVRIFAADHHLTAAQRKESQDICFVPDGKYAEFIERETGRPLQPGCFVDASGKVIGSHRGIARYTIGQRRGLGIAAGHPVFVCEKDAKRNIVRVGEEALLFRKELDVSDINLIACSRFTGKIRAEVKIRYSHGGSPAVVEQTGENSLHIEFDEEQRAVTPGQSAVLYDGDTVIGGGVIV